jgi:hypothetical protein
VPKKPFNFLKSILILYRGSEKLRINFEKVFIMMKSVLVFGVMSSFASSLVSSFALAAPKSAERLAFVKKQLLEISRINAPRLDNWKEVRGILQPLAEEVSSYQFALSAQEQIEAKAGVWQQLWTDDTDDLRANNPVQKTDRERTYQVVFGNGVFYNLAEIKTPVAKFSGFLRGEYEVAEEVFNLEFTDLKLKLGTLGSANELLTTVTKAEEGTLNGLFGLPVPLKYPRGPIGAKGTIKSIYIDNELRVDIGANVADGIQDLFILEKVAQTNE